MGIKPGMAIYDGITLHKPSPNTYHSIMPGAYHKPNEFMLFFDERYGLVKYDGQSWRHSGRSTINNLPTIKETGYIIKPISQNRIALGLTKAGLGVIEPPFDVQQPWKIIGKDQGFSLKNVIGLSEDLNHRIWMGRTTAGIAIYDPVLDTVHSWLIKDLHNLEYGFRGSHIDHKGNLWLGRMSGLHWLGSAHKVDPRDSSWIDDILKINLKVVPEGAASYIFQEDNYLIFGHEAGHGLLDLKSFYLDKENPIVYFFPSNGPNQGGASEQNAYLKDSRGNIWLGKENGAISFRIEDLNLDTLAEELIVDSLYAGNEKVAFKDNRFKLPLAKRNVQIWFNNKLMAS